MHSMMKNFLSGFEHSFENKGDKLIITVSGKKEDIAKLEKKLNALHELCSGEEGCCCC